MSMRTLYIRGIVSVLQMPFDDSGNIDINSLDRLIEDAVDGGVDGFLAPVVASEVAFLTVDERKDVISHVASKSKGRAAFIAGASDSDIDNCRKIAEWSISSGADAVLVAVPFEMYKDPDEIPVFFENFADLEIPLIIQDFEINGPGMDMPTILRLKEMLPNLAGLKIETAPAGPKYTAVREEFGDNFFIAGGWAVPQFIEALDRGVDAMIPESSMVRIYKHVQKLYDAERREDATVLFRKMLPILAFTNQELANSVAFFKRLLVKKGIFANSNMRMSPPWWDEYSERISHELIELYLGLEEDVSKSL
ncbi:MAG: dihydrodipicolinate synthase family protein [Sedimentisphaeraceae bacterium JB056]